MIFSRRRNVHAWILLATCLALVGYFAYHAVHGQHGLRKRAELEGRIRALEGQLAALKAERRRIEHDVALMTTDASRDPDLLDEQARALLNFADPADIIVVRPERGE